MGRTVTTRTATADRTVPPSQQPCKCVEKPSCGPAVSWRAVPLPAVGLALWLSTLPLYSNTITPFQRLAGTSTFVGPFAERSLSLAALVALIVVISSLKGHFAPMAMLRGGSVAYVGGTAAFVAACLMGVPDNAQWLIWPMAGAAALGSVATGLMWGRAYKGLSPRTSLAAIALAAALTAVCGALTTFLPPVALAAVFGIESLLAAVLPGIVGMQNPRCETLLTAEGSCERPLGERLGSLADVAAPALIGLLSFAFVMGTMRALIVDTYPIHLGVLALCALVLGFFALAQTRRPFSRTAYRSLIPTLAVLLLAVTNISGALYGGSWIDMAMVFLLYTLAAVLTLATLGAISHADEFPCDLIISIALMLFCLASCIGLLCAEAMDTEEIKVSTTVITTVYAFAMVLITSLRTARIAAREEADRGIFGPPSPIVGQGTRAAAVGTNEVPRDHSEQAVTNPVADRCAAMAREYRFTAREEQIFTLLAEGRGSGYISEALYISPNTVRTHIHNIYRKLGVNSREELLDRALS